jgi:hypothetical protein
VFEFISAKFVLLSAPLSVQTKEDHSLGLSRGCKENGSLFPSPFLPMLHSSNLPHVDEPCAVGRSLMVSQVLLNRFFIIYLHSGGGSPSWVPSTRRPLNGLF